MSTENLEISIDANIQGAVKGVENFVKVVEKAESPVFDLDKAVKAAMDRISANIDKMADDAIKGTSELEKSIGPAVTAFDRLKQSAGSAKAVFSGASVAGFAKPIKTIPEVADKAATSLGKLGKSGEKSSQVLINAGRILSDSPYGFIGIANNIEPLLESFKRLQTETGSTKNAFKSLLGGLAGGGGFGLAFSAAIAAIQFISLGLDRWTGSTKNATKATKEAADEVKNFADSAAQDIVKVNALASIADDTTRSYKDRKAAIVELRKEYPEYLKGLSDEQALTVGIQGAIDSLTVSIIRRGILLAQQDKINKIISNSLEDVTTQVKDQREQFKNLSSAGNNPFKKVSEDVKEYGTDAVASFGETTDAINKTGAATKTYTLLTKQQLEDAARNGAAIEVFGKIKTSLKDAIQELLSFGATTEDFVKTPLEKAKKAAKELKEQIQKTFGESTAFAGSNIVFQAIAKYDEAQAKKDFEGIQQIVDSFRDGVKIPVSIGNLKMTKELLDLLYKVQHAADAAVDSFNTLKKSIEDTLTNTLANGLAAVGEAIGGLLAGSSSGIGKFVNVIAAGLKAIGEALIQFGVAKIILDKLKSVPGPVAIAAGIGLVALGALLQAKVSSTKFAEGGIVSGPMNAQIGEAGQSEVILPLSRLSGLLSNNRGMVVMETRISGQDILLVQARAAGSRGRTYG